MQTQFIWSPSPPNLELIWKFEKMAASMTGHQILVIKKKSQRSMVKQIHTTFFSISVTHLNSSFQSQFQNVNSVRPLNQRCIELEKLIKNTSAKVFLR